MNRRQNALRVDQDNAYYSTLYKGSYVTAEFAYALLPPGRVTRMAKAAKAGSTPYKTEKNFTKVFQNINYGNILKLHSKEIKYSISGPPSFIELKNMLSSSQQTYKGSSRIAHSLSKHAGRNPEV